MPNRVITRFQLNNTERFPELINLVERMSRGHRPSDNDRQKLIDLRGILLGLASAASSDQSSRSADVVFTRTEGGVDYSAVNNTNNFWVNGATTTTLGGITTGGAIGARGFGDMAARQRGVAEYIANLQTTFDDRPFRERITREREMEVMEAMEAMEVPPTRITIEDGRMVDTRLDPQVGDRQADMGGVTRTHTAEGFLT